MTLVPSLVTRQRQAQKMTLPSQARSSLRMPSTVTLLPTTRITSESSNGTASIDATSGAWSYTSDANFSGSDSFRVTVTDDEGHTETQVISLIVTSVNDPGSFTGNTSATGSEDGATITGTLIFTDAIDGDSVPNYTITSESSNGTASIDATTGAWSYTPNPNFSGSDSFRVTVTDDDGHTETQVVSLIVTSVNDSGSFTGNTSAIGSEDDSAITGTLIFTDAIDGDSVPTTQSRQSRATVLHPSTPPQEHGPTRQTLTLAALILFV